MKKIISLILFATLIVTSMMTLVGCGGEGKKYEIAVVTDVGSLKDGGFNQGTYEGATNYAKANGLNCQYYQPANGADATDNDRVAAMRQAIDNGAQVIVTPGFLQATAIETVAKENPEVKFVFVDGWAMGLPNVTAIVYKEEESGYMAGYAAVKEGYTKLGGTFGGGGSNPAVNRFGYGYVQGIKAAAEENDVDVELKYSYKFGEGFSASNELQAQIASWYAGGTEAVFSCGGSMIQSVKSAAEETADGKIIGVDVDQSKLSDRVITSAIKGLSVSVEKILTEFYNGEWDEKLADKASSLGAADDATGIIISNRLKNFTKDDYDVLFNGIKDGTIQIKSNVPDDCNNLDWLKSVAGSKVTVDLEK